MPPDASDFPGGIPALDQAIKLYLSPRQHRPQVSPCHSNLMQFQLFSELWYIAQNWSAPSFSLAVILKASVEPNCMVVELYFASGNFVYRVIVFTSQVATFVPGRRSSYNTEAEHRTEPFQRKIGRAILNLIVPTNSNSRPSYIFNRNETPGQKQNVSPYCGVT